jgi:hypothetical protein
MPIADSPQPLLFDFFALLLLRPRGLRYGMLLGKSIAARDRELVANLRNQSNESEAASPS